MGEISGYLMLAVYRMFRLLYGSNPKNAPVLFSVPREVCGRLRRGGDGAGGRRTPRPSWPARTWAWATRSRTPGSFAMTTESLSREYPLYATSLLNLIKASELRMKGPEKKAAERRGEKS